MNLLLTFLWAQGDIPVVLGKTGTFLALAYALLQTLVSAYFFFKSREVTELRKDNERARNAAAVAVTELNVHKEASTRKTAELEQAHRLNGELQAKTDIQPLMVQSAQLTKLAIEQMELTRKFERDYANTQATIAAILQKMEEAGAQRYAGAVQAIQSCVTGISELRQEIAQDRMQNQEDRVQNNEAHQGLMRLLASLEARMPKGRAH